MGGLLLSTKWLRTSSTAPCLDKCLRYLSDRLPAGLAPRPHLSTSAGTHKDGAGAAPNAGESVFIDPHERDRLLAERRWPARTRRPNASAEREAPDAVAPPGTADEEDAAIDREIAAALEAGSAQRLHRGDDEYYRYLGRLQHGDGDGGYEGLPGSPPPLTSGWETTDAQPLPPLPLPDDAEVDETWRRERAAEDEVWARICAPMHPADRVLSGEADRPHSPSLPSGAEHATQVAGHMSTLTAASSTAEEQAEWARFWSQHSPRAAAAIAANDLFSGARDRSVGGGSDRSDRATTPSATHAGVSPTGREEVSYDDWDTPAAHAPGTTPPSSDLLAPAITSAISNHVIVETNACGDASNGWQDVRHEWYRDMLPRFSTPVHPQIDFREKPSAGGR